MSTTRSNSSGRRRLWRRPLSVVIVASLTLLLVGMAAWVNYEVQAARRLDAELARLRAAGHPVDDASMAVWFQSHTSRDGTKAWRDVIQLANTCTTGFAAAQELPYVEAGQPLESLVPGTAWPQEPVVAEFLAWTRPLLDKIHEAAQAPAPVWQPIQFQGFQTLLPELQQVRAVDRLLRLEVEHALYHDDADRALRGLESLHGTAAAFDWRFCMVADLVATATRSIHQEAIRRSLTVDIWNEEQLQTLIDQVAVPVDITGRWQDVLGGERAWILAATQDRDLLRLEAGSAVWAKLLVLPSVRESLLDVTGSLVEVGSGDAATVTQRARRWSDEVFAHRFYGARPNGYQFLRDVLFPGIFFPATESYASALEREESWRRFTKTALAIKLFQLRQGRWPRQLSELEQVGLSAQDRTTVLAGPFGYEVGGDAAFLWTAPWPKGKPVSVSPTRPVFGATDDRSILTTIR